MSRGESITPFADSVTYLRTLWVDWGGARSRARSGRILCVTVAFGRPRGVVLIVPGSLRSLAVAEVKPDHTRAVPRRQSPSPVPHPLPSRR